MNLDVLDEKLNKLTKHQLKIIQALYDAGSEWLTRSRLARAIGKKRLTPYDIECLKQLAETELILIDTQPTTAPGSDFAYIYHMPDNIAQAIAQWATSRNGDDDSPKRQPIQLQ